MARPEHAEPRATGARETILIENASAVSERSDRKRRRSLTEYRNPQNEPGSDKRMLLALVAVFVVLGVMQYFMPKTQTPPDKGQQQQQSQQAQQKPYTASPHFHSVLVRFFGSQHHHHESRAASRPSARVERRRVFHNACRWAAGLGYLSQPRSQSCPGAIRSYLGQFPTSLGRSSFTMRIRNGWQGQLPDHREGG